MNDTDIEALFAGALRAGRGELDESACLRLRDALGVAAGPESAVAGAGWRLSIERTRAFGTVLAAGPAEARAYADCCAPECLGAAALAGDLDAAAFQRRFAATIAFRQLTRGCSARAAAAGEALAAVLPGLAALARRFSPANRLASEVIDHLVLEGCTLTGRRLAAAAVRCRVVPAPAPAPPRPIAKIERMLHPGRIGIIGVSASKRNFGRIILGNILASGFDPGRMIVIRQGSDEIDGVRCVDSLAALPEKLDLVVVAVGAGAVFDLVDEVLATDAAEAVMLIPGSMGETEASREPARAMVERIKGARGGGAGAPVFLGGNCLGIVSHPGGYDTWFIPAEKLPRPRKRERRNCALVSQSGAFMITRLSKNPWIDPAYMVAVGNQNDLGHGDFMRYFAAHEEVGVIGFYVEGFGEDDGMVFARAAREATRAGKVVIVYKAGRTAAGQAAALAHTASLAGDFGRCKQVLEQAGAIVCDDIDEFTDLLYLAVTLHDKALRGCAVGAVSGAGFETVGIADSIGAGVHALRLAALAPATVDRLRRILADKGLAALMQVRNPLDINPAADDDAHLQCVDALAGDPGVHLIVVGLDPLSPVTRTLAASGRQGPGIDAPESVVQRLPALVADCAKPIVGIVEGGSLYEPMIERLRDAGVCTLRSTSAAMRALGRYARARCGPPTN